MTCSRTFERTAPPGIHTLLMQFMQVAWKEFNSYVHGGVHALANVGREQPVSFIIQLVCNSNGVAGLGAMLAASLTRDPIVPARCWQPSTSTSTVCRRSRPWVDRAEEALGVHAARLPVMLMQAVLPGRAQENAEPSSSR